MFPRGAHVVGLPAVLPGGRGEQTEGSGGQFEDPGSCLCLPGDDSAELPLSPSDPGDRSACHPVAARIRPLLRGRAALRSVQPCREPRGNWTTWSTPQMVTGRRCRAGTVLGTVDAAEKTHKGQKSPAPRNLRFSQ